jgi:glutathione S-transferase
MKIYGSKNGSNPKKVRIFLAEKNLDIPTVNLDFFKNEQRSPEYLKINSLGTAPSLVLDDGTAITESVAICRYLNDLHPDPPLFGTDALSRAQVEMWSRRIELELSLPCAAVVQHTVDFFADKITQVSAYADAQRAHAAQRFRWLNNEMADGRDFIAGDAYSMADIIAITAVSLAKMMKIGIAEDLTNVHGWHERVAARPSFSA